MNALGSEKGMGRSPEREIGERKLKSVGEMNVWKTDILCTTDILYTTVLEISHALEAMHIVNPNAPQIAPMPPSLLDGIRAMHTENATVGRERLERAAKMHTQVPERYTHPPNGQPIEPTERETDLNADLMWCRKARGRCNVLLDYTETLCNKNPAMSNAMVLNTRALLISQEIKHGVAMDEHGNSELGEGWDELQNMLYEELEQGTIPNCPAEGNLEDIPSEFPGKGSE